MTARPLLCAAVIAALAPAAASAFKISDPLAADPAALRVTVTLPPGFAILKGTARLQVTATDPRSQTATISSDALTETQATGQRHVFGLAEPGTSQFAGLEASVAAWRAAKLPTAARIDVSFTPCRNDPAADPSGRMALTLQPAPGAPRLALVAPDTTLAGYLSGGAAAPITACP